MDRRRQRPGGRATADQLARSVGLTLQRLTAAFSVATPRRRPSLPARSEHDVLARTRAALTDAREQMPGLMSLSSPMTVESIEQEDLVKRTPVPVPATLLGASQSLVPQDLRLARMEEVVVRLEAERAQARAEIEALRQIAEELRETLAHLDDRSFASAASPATSAAPELDNHAYPAGSVGVELRVDGFEHELEIEQLRSALASRPEIDAVRVTRMRKRKARLRIYLRLPLGRAAYLALLRHAAPFAVPMPGSSPGSISLLLHPS